MYFGTDYKELYHESKITLPQLPPTLCGTKSGFAPGMKPPASLKVICIEPQDCLVRAAGSQLHDVIFGILRPFVKIIDKRNPSVNGREVGQE